MEKGLVSVITPCYNTAHLVSRLLDSILAQDYPSIEMLMVDDGSKDNLHEVVASYIPRYQKKGYRLTLLRQANQGQSVAVNNALKQVNGEFLVWPDSDDWYRSNHAISLFVQQLQELPKDYALVRCFPTYINDETGSERTIEMTEVYFEANQFENCLYSRNFLWNPGNYMVKMACFDKVNPKREIYTEKNAGQNWQMFLPLLYSYKCLTLKESFFNVLERPESHSRGQYKTYEQQVAKFDSYRNTVISTLSSIATMPKTEVDKLSKSIINKYRLIHLDLALLFNKNEDARLLKQELKHDGIAISRKHELSVRIRKYLLGRLLLRLYSLFPR